MPFVAETVVIHVSNLGRVRPLAYRGAVSVPKTLSIIFGALRFVLAVSAPSLFAALPVDLFQDMESGNDGELLTPSIMGASCHGGGTTWSINGQMWVSTRNAIGLPGPLVVGGVTYTDTHATRSWMFNDNNPMALG
jgi:hypothetical protein